MNEKKRNNILDILKGIGIILIVLGHTGFKYTNFIYLFHMAIFFIASGYLYKDKYTENKEEMKKFIIKKIKRLYIPFLICNLLGVLLNNFFIDTNIYDLANHNMFELKDFGINILKVILFHNNTEIFGATWFLRILFEVSIIYSIIDYFLNKKIKKYKHFVQIIISFCFCLIGFVMIEKNISLPFLDITMLETYILFELGVIIKKYTKENIKNIYKIIILIFSFLLLIILNKCGEIEMSKNIYTNLFYYLIASISGWYLIYEISYFISKIKIINKIFEYIGNKSFSILIWHFTAFKLVNYFGVIFYNMNFSNISKFPVLLKNGYWYLIYTLVGIIIPLILDKIYSLLKELINRRKNEIRSSNNNI